jgi:hypothetical protein
MNVSRLHPLAIGLLVATIAACSSEGSGGAGGAGAQSQAGSGGTISVSSGGAGGIGAGGTHAGGAAGQGGSGGAGGSSARANAIWMKVDDQSSATFQALSAGNIRLLLVEVGEWEADGTIHYFYGDNAVYTDFIGAAKAVDSGFQVLAWVFAVPGYQPAIDLGNPAIEATMVSEIVSCVSIGFDGFHEDVETNAGTNADLVAFWNDMATQVRGVGGLATVAAMNYYAYPVESIYPFLQVDYLATMLYDGGSWGEADLKALMDRALTQSASPVLLGIRIDGYATAPLSSIITWMDAQIASGGPYDQLAGFSPWEFDLMRPEDWAAWQNWPTKD